MLPASTPKKAVTAKNALITFYDVESLEDAFTLAAFTPKLNRIDLFHLVEQGSPVDREMASLPMHEAAAQIRDAVRAANPAFHGSPENIHLNDLSKYEGVAALARLIGLFEGDDVNDPASQDAWNGAFRPVCDTDPRYDPVNLHPYLAGYNSYAYDTTILAEFFVEALQNLRDGKPFAALSPRIMREHNNEMFSAQHRSFMPSYLTEGKASYSQGRSQGWDSLPARIRKAMLDSGRHIDVSRLNESQRMVGLKRLLGGLGRQILESEKLGNHNARLNSFAELCELLAYNVSDVVGLGIELFEHPAYSSSFDLKKGLLDEYPETVYKPIRGTHRPDISQKSVRMGRLTPDSTSAKFVARILAPYKDLEDIPAVSFMYPSETVAREQNIERRNVLDDCIAFFEKNIDRSTADGQKAHRDFQAAMSYYKSIEGRNFNDAQGDVDMTLSQVPRTPNNLPYFNRDGSPSSCFVTFSTGGIHGAEYDVHAYEQASASVDAFNARMREVRDQYPDPLEFWLAHPGKKTFIASDGTEMTRAQVLTSGTSLKLLKAKREQDVALEEWLETDPDAEEAAQRALQLEAQFQHIGYRPDKPRPELFEKAASGATKLRAQFTHTSAALVIHEDFTSYYPNLLRNMSAFYNPDLGEDRYAKIFEDKERYGREMKKPGISADEKARLDVLRNGTKLILNSASGAGDTTHKNPIRMNNQIISMRIIGQLVSWRIGQAQTLAGARIVSTNTDGLYSVLDEETNNRVLAEQAAIINVAIEPEPLWLISKDSNNRLELEVPKPGEPLHEAKFVSASGGTLACHKGPQPTKSLAHPAVLDWALARYLREIVGGRTIGGKPLSLDEPMNRDVARWLMETARDQEDALLAARLFQNVLAASPGKITFPFACDPIVQYEDVAVPIDPHDVGPGAQPRTTKEPVTRLLTGVRALQHYNRVFIMKPGTPETVSIQAAGAWVVNESSRVKRKAEGLSPVNTDAVAHRVLAANGYSRDGRAGTQTVPFDQDIAVRKVPRLNPEWAMRIDNRDLVEIADSDPTAIRWDILSQLDLDAYVEMLASTFEENWMNTPRVEASEAAGSGLAVEDEPDMADVA